MTSISSSTRQSQVSCKGIKYEHSNNQKIPEDGHRSFKIEVGFGETGKSPVVADQRYRTRTTVSDEMPDQLLIGLTDIIDDFLIKALCLHIFSVTDHPTKLFFCD
mmetsp:Transcript_22993/g.51763  ORF Transcript_22993/g.51763 Transcript_22993/m.51763 type:complete len:105 (+) Transcript_22993:569-883(+)